MLICLKSLHPDAPLRAAASKTSFGVDDIMLRLTSTIMGVHSQASERTITGKKAKVEVKSIYGSLRTKCRKVLISSQTAEGDQSIPATIGAVATGASEIARTTSLPRNFCVRRNVSNIPIPNATSVLPMEYSNDTPTALKKAGSLSNCAKLAPPANPPASDVILR